VSVRPVLAVLCGGLMDSVPDWEVLRPLARVEVASCADDLAGLLPDADILFLWDFRFGQLDVMLPAARELKWVHVAGVGVDAIVSPALASSGVIVTNSRTVFDDAIAEYVAGLLLAWVKDFSGTWRRQAGCMWQHRTTRMLKGQRIAVVGTGSIGCRIGSVLNSLGATITLVGRRSGTHPELGRIVPSSHLTEIASQVGALVLAAPLTPLTEGIVKRATLAALGPDGYLVNVGRGALVLEPDLVEALSAGELGGAALDVFEHEPLPSRSPLWAMPNVVISPHMSGDFDGYETALMQDFAQNLRKWLVSGRLDNIVDINLGYVPRAGF
jgi:phosphoglycerate dehydrogenase-like enzyme